ncbi:XTP/dITP diphosphatase [Aestuariibacter halophilus]|uniref:dITP/XTP pyrophosphatase n=1 Tax=Fluctibacter halophilus TaxID=226011 RepID=A0ABS8G7R6_9ALTE|nr:XTP/dITP diphosphatase [Aestuariibacter halophilus]MCC2616632.1 XTP/dITP diphosphatase [Aestuariibacter halophilus]
MQIVLATGNQGKVNELASMLEPMNIDVLPQSQFDVPDVAETGTTFVENAIIKARHAARITGLPAIADDSGLAVDALGGAPGVYSSRYAGPDASDQDNIEKLLAAMKDVPIAKRQARFLCVLVFMRSADDPTPLICQGEWAGRIHLKAEGQGGFGYDPVFFIPDKACVAAQLSAVEKNAMSHRGHALRQLVEQLDATFAD